MDANMDHNRPIVDRYTRGLLTMITVLLTIIAVELAYHAPVAVPSARAQIPDTAGQRHQIIEESRKSNQLLSAILEHLRTKSVKVELKETDTRKEAVRPSGTPKHPRGSKN